MRTCGVLDHSPMPGGTAEGPQPHVSRAMSWPADGPISPTQPALDLVQRWGLGNMAATRSDDEQEEEEEEEEEEEYDPGMDPEAAALMFLGHPLHSEEALDVIHTALRKYDNPFAEGPVADFYAAVYGHGLGGDRRWQEGARIVFRRWIAHLRTVDNVNTAEAARDWLAKSDRLLRNVSEHDEAIMAECAAYARRECVRF
eukprot:TRINITY_DN4960_c0_g2_i1.p1 TRINITY_DN4960_c0_g2~~TRINITY_DN4960_c0_g2_i1.p1  ORF type:complete len:232 (-),score=48.74 TRINITY_DN4960_c0_g2_i1:408-1007(-)